MRAPECAQFALICVSARSHADSASWVRIIADVVPLCCHGAIPVRCAPNRRSVVRSYAAVCLSLCLVAWGAARQEPASKPARATARASTAATRPDPSRWEKDISAFEAWDRKNTPPRDAILFVGSSSIVGWSTAEAFAEWPVINRGFGGSHLIESTYYFDRIIAPYRPRAIVLYAGDNDVAAGVPAEQVAADFSAFVERVRSKFPETPIIFLSIKPSMARWEHWPTMREANRRIAALCAEQPNLRFVDVAGPMLDEKGEPRAEFFVADRLHLSAKGYAAWERVLRPVLAELLREDRRSPGAPGTRPASPQP